MKFTAIFFLLAASLTAMAQNSIFTSETAPFPYDKTGPVIETRSTSFDGPEGFINPTTYQFSALSGVPLENMAGSTLLIGANSDNIESTLRQIGFLYRFDGGFYTSFGASSNGLVKLGGITVPPNFNNTLNSDVNSPKIAPYWDDLCLWNNGSVRYKMVPGPIGIQKLVIEWTNVQSRGQFCNGQGSEGTFQLWLFDRTGVIQFVYGPGIGMANAQSGGYSIGVQAGAAANFASITAFTNSINYATANNAQITAIPAGTSYLLSPPIPAAVTNLTPTPGQTSVALNWTDNATDETSYLVRRTTDHTNFYFVGITPANSTSFTDTGLATSTQYFYYVNALTDGAFSPDALVGTTTLPAQTITAAAAGGPWSSPATWAGNAVPDAGDDVVIADGSTVVIDTAAEARSVTVGSPAPRPGGKDRERGPEGGAPAVLRFGETAAFSLNLINDMSVSSNGTFSTGGGNANQHVLTINGNLVNNGIFDLSTNNNQAGAGLVFKGSTSNTFSGTGSVTDVRTITIDKGTSHASVLEISVSNFTVQGSAADGPDAGYLYLLNGSYKISGTFTGNFRTFPNANYQIPTTTGFILNNPNYSVTAQESALVPVTGKLVVSAGTFNVGRLPNDSLAIAQGSTVIIEGGRVNTAGAFKTQSIGSSPFSFTQTGGTITTCTVLGSTSCYTIIPTLGSDSISIPGGEIVVQNSGQAVIGSTVDMTGSSAVVRLGNESTFQPSFFGLGGDDFPNVVLDTRAGGHVLRLPSAVIRIAHVEVGIGGYFDVNNATFYFTGESFVNNGLLLSPIGGGRLIWAGQNPVYSGNGFTDVIHQTELQCQSLTLDAPNGYRVRHLSLITGNLIHSERLIIGNNDANANNISFGQSGTANTGGTLDAAPVFDIGNGTQNVIYQGGTGRSTGFEINPARSVDILQFSSNVSGARLNIAGGDITVQRLFLTSGEIATGQFKIIHTGDTTTGQGFVSGEIQKKFTSNTQTYSYFFAPGPGVTGQVFVALSSLNVNPSYLSIRKIPGPMPGLLPAKAASVHWRLTETGSITGTVRFSWLDSEIRGNEANYVLWRDTGSGPFDTPWMNRIVGNNTIQTGNLTSEYDGLWGIGEAVDPGPVSIGGSVLTSGGAGIRNAVLTISGGNLPSPVSVQTGQFGTYNFTGLQAGEVYTITVSAKRFRFTTSTRQVTPLGNLTDINFTANPQEGF